MVEVKELVDALKNGNVVFGTKSTVELLLTSEPDMIILSSNCPKDEKESLLYYSKLAGVPVKVAEEKSIELGSMCGKPYRISAAAIVAKGGKR
ncbi:MAG: 50S ribosomal protein L30e [Candidatus Altiarchaeota archaeon]